MSKIAIILLGHLRTWNECKESFINKFNQYNPDVYVITYDTPDYKSEIKLTKQEIEDDLSGINVVHLEIKDENVVFNETKEKYERFCIGDTKERFTSCLCQYNNLQKCFKVIEETGIKYDYVVKTRFDIRYHFEEDIFRPYGQIFTSNQHNVCDFFACANFDDMRVYCGAIDKLEFLYEKYFYPDITITPHIMIHYTMATSHKWYTNNLHVEVVRK